MISAFDIYRLSNDIASSSKVGIENVILGPRIYSNEAPIQSHLNIPSRNFGKGKKAISIKIGRDFLMKYLRGATNV